MDIDLITLWGHMNLAVKGVVIVLTIQAVACIAVVIERCIALAIAKSRSKEFAARADSLLSDGNHDAVIKLANETKGSPLAELIGKGLEVFGARVSEGVPGEKAAELTARALERKGENLGEGLHRGMNVLASTGSTAPFVGLLGTVLGILNAFKLIAESGSGGMGTIGAAIGEALIVTGYGLTVAIPSVLLFNWLSGRIASYESGLGNAGSELVDRLEAESVRVPSLREHDEISGTHRAHGSAHDDTANNSAHEAA